MAYRYIQINALSEAHDDEQICAVYENPRYNTTGTKKDEQIVKALKDSLEDKCRLVVWRNDDNKDYYQYIDRNGRLRERESAAAKVINFEDYSRPQEDEGYTYFAVGILEALNEGIGDGHDAKVQVKDRTGKVFDVVSAHMDPETNTITLAF